MIPTKALNKEFDGILEMQKKSMQSIGMPTPGIVMNREDGSILIFPLWDNEKQEQIDLFEFVSAALPGFVNSLDYKIGIISYFICLISKQAYEYSDNMITHKLVIVYGDLEKEEIREYYMPTMAEANRTKLKADKRTEIGMLLEPYLSVDPDIFKPDLLGKVIRNNFDISKSV